MYEKEERNWKILLICLEEIFMFGRLFSDYNKTQFWNKLHSKNLPLPSPPFPMPQSHAFSGHYWNRTDIWYALLINCSVKISTANYGYPSTLGCKLHFPTKDKSSSSSFPSPPPPPSFSSLIPLLPPPPPEHPFYSLGKLWMFYYFKVHLALCPLLRCNWRTPWRQIMSLS